MQLGDEPRPRRDFARLGQPKVGEVRKEGVAGSEVIFENWQWVERPRALFQDNRRTLPKPICLMHGQEEGGMRAGGGSQLYRATLDSLPVVTEAELIWADEFA